MSDRRFSLRVVAVMALLAVVFALLGVRLGMLHALPHEELRERMDPARQVRTTLVVNRGRILDRNGAILATDQLVFDVNVDPDMLIKDQYDESVAAHLSRVLSLPPADVLEKCRRPGRRQVYIQRGIPVELAEQVRRMKLPHVWLDSVSARHYPQSTVACHVVGFSNVEGDGLAGIERVLNKNLRGVPGELVSMRDARGREQLGRRLTERPPEPGDTVELTIDSNLQRIMEDALAAAVTTNHAQGAWSVMMDVRTGEILAMASMPTFDLNEYSRAPTESMLNRVIGYSYEPGSTFKVGVIAAALNEGLVKPETTFDCEHGAWSFAGKILHDYHPYGVLSVADVLKKSSNIGAAKIALLLGASRLESYLRGFGIGARTQSGLPGEEPGLLHAATRWGQVDLTRIAMGHSVMVTSLQMLNEIACLGNEGVRMQPAVIRRVISRHGIVLQEFRPHEVARPVRKETAQLMVKLMARVTEEGGTGKKAAVAGYQIAGKTGTSVKLTNGHYDGHRNIASFVGLAPATRPRLAMIVVVDEPQPEHTGGLVAGPVFSRIAREALQYLDIPPDGVGRTLQIEPDSPLPEEEDIYAAGFAL